MGMVNLVVQDMDLQRISDDSDCEDRNSECIAAVVRVTSKQFRDDSVVVF